MRFRDFARACRRCLALRSGDDTTKELEKWRVIGKKVRWFAAYRYIRGSGIEIGALNLPLPTYHGAKVRYVDRLPTDQLRLACPEFADQPLVEVEHVEDGEKLSRLPDESCDFIIANHMIEHTRNPIGAIENMFRVLRPNGVLYLALPDKRFTFDAERAVTSYEHLKRDYFESPEWSDAEHYLDWARSVGKIGETTRAAQEADKLLAGQANIHFHVWTQRDFIKLVLDLRRDFHLPIEIEAVIKNSQELVVVLRKADLG
ncbi:MAG: class I SAM-dependent methyltransferase [Spartobacteria bacterium]